jgi:hypothetical protein
MKLELENALCIIKMGWSTKEEKELFDIAYDIVNKKSKILHLEYQKSFIDGANWQSERMYSEEEVYSLLEQSMKDCHLWELEEHSSMGDYINLKEWFEEFKKK